MFQKLSKYHTHDKLSTDKDQDVRMIDAEAEETKCAEEHDILGSQSFMNDFIEFLDVIASKIKQRSVCIGIFSQIQSQILDVITVQYTPYVDPVTKEVFPERCMYPLNFSCQIKAIKLLRTVLKSQQSFDDTAKLDRVIEKLRNEIEIIYRQSQHHSDNEDDYQMTYNQSWLGDDDYVSKYQKINMRHMLIKHMFKFLGFCIVRNDPNLVSYNQNFIAHSRKILESSILQDDLLIKILKIHETLPTQEHLQVKAQIEQTVSPLVLDCVNLTTNVFNDLPSKIQTFITNGVFHSVISCLTHGGIPSQPDMVHILAQFMHMLTLNQESMKLLVESKFLPVFCKLCLNPVKYFKNLEITRRRDEYFEQVLQGVANSNSELSEQMIDAITEIYKMILPMSHQLLVEYIDMDQRKRPLDNQLKENGDTLTEEEKEKLHAQINQIKDPYELKLKHFENFFKGYNVTMQFFLEDERAEFG